MEQYKSIYNNNLEIYTKIKVLKYNLQNNIKKGQVKNIRDMGIVSESMKKERKKCILRKNT